MAVVDVTRMWSKDGGSISSDNADPFGRQFSFSEGYQVLCDSTTDHELTVAAASGVPRIGDTHRSGTGYCISVRATKVGPVFWLVEVGYDGEDIDSSVEIEWSDSISTEPIDRDWAGAAIVTTNNEQVDGLSTDIADPIVIIRRKFVSINLYAIRAYRRSVNSDTFLGWPAGTARLVGYSARNRYRYGSPQELWDVTARIQFREPHANTTSQQAWYKRWRHEGLLVKKSGVIQRATDSLGQEETKPVLLKIDGTRETDPDAAYFVHTKVYGDLPYSGLGLL